MFEPCLESKGRDDSHSRHGCCRRRKKKHAFNFSSENPLWPICLRLKSTGENLSDEAVPFFLCMSDNTACNTISVSTAGAAADARHLSWETISLELQRRTMISKCAHRLKVGGGVEGLQFSYTIDPLHNQAMNYITFCVLRIADPHHCPASPSSHTLFLLFSALFH